MKNYLLSLVPDSNWRVLSKLDYKSSAIDRYANKANIWASTRTRTRYSTLEAWYVAINILLAITVYRHIGKTCGFEPQSPVFKPGAFPYARFANVWGCLSSYPSVKTIHHCQLRYDVSSFIFGWNPYYTHLNALLLLLISATRFQFVVTNAFQILVEKIGLQKEKQTTKSEPYQGCNNQLLSPTKQAIQMELTFCLFRLPILHVIVSE